MSALVHVGFFADEPSLLAALERAQEEGLCVEDVWTPHPIHGLDGRLGLRRSRLPVVCFVGGVIGLAGGFGLQYWASAIDWPLDVGGMPFNSFPAFVPMGFELTILVAGLCTVAGLLIGNRLRPGRRVVEGLRATSDDRYALVVRVPDGAVREGAVGRVWAECGALDRMELPREDLT